MGEFSSVNWDQTWRKKIYSFGELFNDTNRKDAAPFLGVIETALVSSSEPQTEIINFIKSEVVYNFFEDIESKKKFFEDLKSKYPTNPEFHQTFSHLLEAQSELAYAVAEAKLAVRLDPNTVSLVRNAFNKEKRFYDLLLGKGDISGCEDVLRKMRDYKPYKTTTEFNNYIVVLEDRLSDHKIIEKKISGIDEIIKEKTDEERKKLIEVLGFFVAILGFVFLTTSLATNKDLNIHESLFLMLSMAIVLLIFSTSISYLFTRHKSTSFLDFLAHRKFWAIVMLVVALVLLVKYGQIVV